MNLTVESPDGERVSIDSGRHFHIFDHEGSVVRTVEELAHALVNVEPAVKHSVEEASGTL